MLRHHASGVGGPGAGDEFIWNVQHFVCVGLKLRAISTLSLLFSFFVVLARRWGELVSPGDYWITGNYSENHKTSSNTFGI